MSDQSYAVYIEGLSEAYTELESLPDRVKVAARRAVNRATSRAKTAASRQMRDQIAWTASYLDGKLSVKLANESDSNPEGVVGAVFRPTSLARFATGAKTPWKYAKQLHVGAAKYAPTNGRMLFVPLKAGKAAISEDQMNIGLAIRLKEGDTIKGKYNMKPISNGLYLLYGPSAAQVFFTVAKDIIPDVEQWLGDEFTRQMNRKDV